MSCIRSSDNAPYQFKKIHFILLNLIFCYYFYIFVN